jgi:predicted deacetylase
MTASLFPQVNFSELSKNPGEVADKVADSATRAVLVRRRKAGDEDLVLTTASHAQQQGEVTAAATRMFVAMIQHDPQAVNRLAEVAPTAFPWVRFLPPGDVTDFVSELVETLQAADGLDQNPAPVLQVIDEWRNTAAIHADPDLLELLRTDEGDLGPVPDPTSV